MGREMGSRPAPISVSYDTHVGVDAARQDTYLPLDTKMGVRWLPVTLFLLFLSIVTTWIHCYALGWLYQLHCLVFQFLHLAS